MITDDKLYDVLQAQIDDEISIVLFGMGKIEMARAAFDRNPDAFNEWALLEGYSYNEYVRDCLSIQALRAISAIEFECSQAFTDIGKTSKSFDDLITRMVVIARDIAMKHKPDDLQIWYEDQPNE